MLLIWCLGLGWLLPLVLGGCAISPDSTGLVTIPASWTSIGNYTFEGCSSLTSVFFESGSQLQTIGGDAFSGSGLTTITIPASVTSIGKDAFAGCNSLTSVFFESGSQLHTIDDGAFRDSGLTTITIPASVTSIGSTAFGFCYSLTSVFFESGSQLQTIDQAAGQGAFWESPNLITCNCGGAACPKDVFGDILVCTKACPVGERYTYKYDAICVKCPIKSACPDGLSCAVGYEGNGCATCSSGYFYINDSCMQCPETDLAVLLTLGLLFTCVLGVGVYYLSGKLINLAGLSTISIGHFQSITIFMTLTFPIPDLFYMIAKNIQAVFAFMYVDLFFSPDCVADISFFDKWKLLTFLPIGILVAIYAFEGCMCRLRADKESVEFENVDQDESLPCNDELVISTLGVEEKSVKNLQMKEIPSSSLNNVVELESISQLQAESEVDDAESANKISCNTKTKSTFPSPNDHEKEKGCCRSYCCCCWYCCCCCLPELEFGRMLNVGILIFYVYILGQCWQMWDCIDAIDGLDYYYVKSNPSIQCFEGPREGPHFTHAVIALILVLVCTYIPFKLYDNLKYELFISKHSKLDHEKNMGFLYLKYKPEYWYWEPVVDMSRKWLLIFFSTFLPSGELQAIADIVIILVYWGLHVRYLPFRTDWKDEDGNPADPDLENNLQHCMYAIQLLIIIVMFAHSSYEDDPNVGGAVLLVFYFLGIVFLGYAIGRSMLRHDARKKDIENKDDKDNIELSTLSKMLRRVFEGVH